MAGRIHAYRLRGPDDVFNEFAGDCAAVRRLVVQRMVRQRFHGSSKPILVHLTQELRRERKAGLGTNNRIDAAPWTKRSGAGSCEFVSPVLNLSRGKSLAAVKTTANLTRKHLIAMIAGTIVRRLQYRVVVLGHGKNV